MSDKTGIMDKSDYSMLRSHYLNLMVDINLLTRIAASQGYTIEQEYLACKRQVSIYTKKIEELEEQEKIIAKGMDV